MAWYLEKDLGRALSHGYAGGWHAAYWLLRAIVGMPSCQTRPSLLTSERRFWGWGVRQLQVEGAVTLADHPEKLPGGNGALGMVAARPTSCS